MTLFFRCLLISEREVSIVGVRMGAKGADSKGNPFHSRRVTYCTDPDPLLMARELEELEEGEEVVANMFSVYTCEKVRDAHHKIKVSSG